MPTRVRVSALENAGVGASRYQLIRASAERIAVAQRAGFYIEATALIESVLADRLEKRVQYLYKHATSEQQKKKLAPLSQGFQTLGALCKALRDDEDREYGLLVRIADQWRARRNKVVHEMAKLDSHSPARWDQRLAETGEVCAAGVSALLAIDVLDRARHHHGMSRKHASATCPDALTPLGQPYCEWCAGPKSDAGLSALRRRSKTKA